MGRVTTREVVLKLGANAGVRPRGSAGAGAGADGNAGADAGAGAGGSASADAGVRTASAAAGANTGASTGADELAGATSADVSAASSTTDVNTDASAGAGDVTGAALADVSAAGETAGAGADVRAAAYETAGAARVRTGAGASAGGGAADASTDADGTAGVASATTTSGAVSGIRARDTLAVEEPLEIRVAGRQIAVTMRTPGDDFDLVAGYLVGEGVIRRPGQLARMRFCGDSACAGPIGLPTGLAGSANSAGVLNLLGHGTASGHVEGEQVGHGPVGDKQAATPGLTRHGQEAAIGRVESAHDAYNIVDVDLAPGTALPLWSLDRTTYTTSACGVCGKSSIEAVRANAHWRVDSDSVRISPQTLYSLPKTLRAGQKLFAKTGGLHAAGLFTSDGELLCVREDVGRHNAVDKVVGWALRADRLPLRGHLLAVSGRASFELVQKAAAAGIPVLAAVSAPSSLAVELARAAGMTLAGFVRGESANVYTGMERISLDGPGR